MSAVWYPFDVYPNTRKPNIVRAQGAWLYADDGQKFLDAIGSWWVCLHGHNHPRLQAALMAQAWQMDQIIYSGFTHAPAENLATALVQRYPGAHKCFYSDDGSTAVEVALKLALHAQGRMGKPQATQILTLANSYHGDTIGAMSAAQQGLFTKPYTPFLFDAHVLSLPYTTDISSSQIEGDHRAIADAEEAFGTGKYAAFLLEPLVQGAGGMRFYRSSTLVSLMALARTYGVLVIADEVMTGFGRTGTLFAADHLPHPPDLACLSKGLTGGMLPLGVTLASEAIWNLFADAPLKDKFLHGHSFTANPITCAVALESWHLLHEPEETNRRKLLYKNLSDLATRLSANPSFENVRQLGGILAVDIRSKNATGYLNPIGQQAYNYFLERGLLMRPLGNTVYLLPPYCITLEELTLCEQALVSFAGQV